ncbi:MAG: protein kinase [Candidatus Eremiobacteraeota bacterium]|nr:protein kinase [Candidatus Eremiobacteraeota bacterium]
MNGNPEAVFGRYVIIEEIDRGAMGIIYKAKDMTLDRYVALKKLILNPVLDEESKKMQVERFVREAKSIARLSHPNIVSVYDAGQSGEDYYIAMEFVEGKTLENYVERGKPFHVSEVIEISIQVLRALGHAHKNNIVHRDVKPGNIMMLGSDYVKVMDFGIAKALDMGTMTSTGATLGTIGYMSPEQWGNSGIDGRSDIFSYSVIMYQMLTGEMPFPSDSIALHVANLISESFQPASVRQVNKLVPASLEQIVMKGLCKERKYRYQNAEDMISDLNTVKNEMLSNVNVQGAAEPDRKVKREERLDEIEGKDKDSMDRLPDLSIVPSGKNLRSKAPFIIIGLLIVIGVILAAVRILNPTRPPTSSSHTIKTPSTHPSVLKPTTGYILFRTQIEGVLIKVFHSDGKPYTQWLGDRLIIKKIKNEDTSNNKNGRNVVENRKGVKIELPPGTYTIKLKRDHYYKINKKGVKIKKGALIVIDDEWIKKPSITITTNVKKAEVYLNNSYKGDTGKGGLQISDLESGQYNIAVKKSGYVEERREIRLGESTQQKLEFNLTPVKKPLPRAESSPNKHAPTATVTVTATPIYTPAPTPTPITISSPIPERIHPSPQPPPLRHPPPRPRPDGPNWEPPHKRPPGEGRS